MKVKIVPLEMAHNVCKNKLYNGRGIQVLEETDDFFIVNIKRAKTLNHIKRQKCIENCKVMDE